MLSNNIPTTNLLSLKAFTNIFMNSSLSVSSRLQCFFSNIFSQHQLLYMNSLFTVVFSTMSLNIYIFCLAILVALQKIIYKSFWISTAIFYLLMMNYANYFDYLIQLVTWREISGIKWVTYNLSLRYDQNGNYFSIIAIVLPQILNVMFLPIILFLILKKHVNYLDDQNTYKHLGYFYKDYSYNRYYWGIVQKVLRSLSIVVSYLFYNQEIIKILLQVSYLLVFQRIQQFQQPYSIHRLNNADSLLIYFQCLSIVILGLTQSMSDNQNAQIHILLFTFYLVNLIVLLLLLRQVFIVKKKDFSSQINKISESIQKISPKLGSSLRLASYVQSTIRTDQNIKKFRKAISQICITKNKSNNDQKRSQIDKHCIDQNQFVKTFDQRNTYSIILKE